MAHPDDQKNLPARRPQAESVPRYEADVAYDDDAPDDPPPRRRSVGSPPPRRRRPVAYDDDYDYDDYDDDYRPRVRRRPPPPPPPPRNTASGCAQATLYVVIGALVALLVMLFFFNNAVSNVADVFRTPGSIPLTASPTPTIRTNAAAVVRRVQQLSRLETTSYTVETVIEAGVQGNAFENLLFGDRLLLIARGRVEAGIDLAQVVEDDVLVSPDGSTLTVYLPPVEIFSVTLDNNATRVYDRQQGLLAAPNENLETIARQNAEQRILEAACEDGVMQRATDDSQRALEQFLGLLDVEQVYVRPASVPACVAPTP